MVLGLILLEISALRAQLNCFPSQQPRPCGAELQTERSLTVVAATRWPTSMTLRLCSSRSHRAVLCST